MLVDYARTDRRTTDVLGIAIDVVGWNDVIYRISQWADNRESRVVCICNVHSIVNAQSDPTFASVLNSADMATPDGAPVAWMLSAIGKQTQERINGPDLMWEYCQYAAATAKQSIYLYGSTGETLARLRCRLEASFPDLKIAGTYSPPFNAMSSEEDAALVSAINDSGACVVWVALGCPKQEMWMAAHRDRIHAVMVGVGAAFDYHAGTVKRAPRWMQNNGLEWFYRLANEPRRLWKRYLVTNTLFIWLALRQLLTKRYSVHLP